jgi:hypothetical protein
MKRGATLSAGEPGGVDAGGQQRFDVFDRCGPGQLGEQVTQISVRLDAIGLGPLSIRSMLERCL